MGARIGEKEKVEPFIFPDPAGTIAARPGYQGVVVHGRSVKPPDRVHPLVGRFHGIFPVYGKGA